MKRENEFPLDIGSEVQGLGTIEAIKQEIPGVYFLSIDLHLDCGLFEECYAVLKSASDISKEAKAYGRQFPDLPEILFYQMDSDDCDGSWKIISYEIEKYRRKHRCSTPVEPYLLEIAWEGMEICPEYFGSYPVPVETPWGYTVRHKAISNGVYWLETATCKQVVAIYRGMRDDLSGMAQELSVPLSRGALLGLPEVWGYFFFEKEDSCIPIFEMLPLHPEWTERGIIDKKALMNAIIQKYPQYALQYNFREQLLENDLLNKLLKDAGIAYTPNRSLKNIISLSDGAGVEFYTFLR